MSVVGTVTELYVDGVKFSVDSLRSFVRWARDGQELRVKLIDGRVVFEKLYPASGKATETLE